MANPAKNKLAKPVILDKDARDTPAVSLRDYINMVVKAVYKCIDGLRDYVNKRFDGVDKRIDRLEQNMDKRFDDVDKRFDKVDKRFDRMEDRALKIWVFSMSVMGAGFIYIITLLHQMITR